ncbi:MAG: type II toxin-antitoxin system RelE/ParE family toxin [Candidatus Omnitrophica bacterium]|nr:type II toxin-antitoxin system RelE/ParE family toxin [Candidatus Omnitrophota bacterium]
MEISFKNARIKKECEDYKKLVREYGSLQARKIVARINEFNSAESLYDISRLPQARLHKLSGDLKGCFAVDVKHPYRIIILPLDGEAADLKTITKIKIEKIYHNYH